MSEAAQTRPTDSLLYSDQLFRVLGGDAMQMLRCGICMEFFDVPIVLPCGHTFCLHCLTEMCKHASRNCVLSPLKDLRIGCPNCRVLIYASPILERNVTCNFIIQSLIECLRARESGRRQSIGVNTDEVRVGPKIRAVSEVEMERVIKEVDRLTESLGKRNVIDNAYFEIDAIRRQHLARRAKQKEEEDEQLQQQLWNQTRSIQQCPIQLRLQQQPFYQQQLQQQQQQHHQQQQQLQVQQCPRTFNWEDLNSQIKTMTPPPSSVHYQQQQPPGHLKQYIKTQHLQSPLPQQQQQQQQQPTAPIQLRVQPQLQHQQQVWSSLSKISKLATVLPLQRCPDSGQFSGTLGQFDLSSGHGSRLDNDPAIMSYSYKAAINPMVNK